MPCAQAGEVLVKELHAALDFAGHYSGKIRSGFAGEFCVPGVLNPSRARLTLH